MRKLPKIAKIPKIDENSKITKNRQNSQTGRKLKITKNHKITNLGIYRKIDDRRFTTRQKWEFREIDENIICIRKIGEFEKKRLS